MIKIAAAAAQMQFKNKGWSVPSHFDLIDRLEKNLQVIVVIFV